MPLLNIDPDNENHAVNVDTGEHYYKRAGQSFAEFLEGLADSPPDSEVPAPVTPLQARRALSHAGLREAVEAWVAAQPRDVQDAWEFASEIRRDDPLIAAAAAALSLSTDALDDLFALAAGL
jgi:hypothetical protein